MPACKTANRGLLKRTLPLTYAEQCLHACLKVFERWRVKDMHAPVQDGENILAGTAGDPWLRGVRTYLKARGLTHTASLRDISCPVHTMARIL